MARGRPRKKPLPAPEEPKEEAVKPAPEEPKEEVPVTVSKPKKPVSLPRKYHKFV